jgi:AcrR family transcriptional regulator
MARWEPDAPGRLAQAALELFAERGFEQTTVAEIADRAGLTKRTFFRHFPDKREVLFGGGHEFRDRIVGGVAGAPASAGPMEAVAEGLQAAAAMLEQRRPFAHRRAAVIAASDELQERELVKLATVAGAMAAALRERGVEEPAASLTAEAGMAVFRVAFERWATDPAQRELSELIRESLGALRTVAAA